MLDSAYVSRVFPLNAADAIEATESWCRGLKFAPGGRWLVGGPKLLLRPGFASTDFDAQLLRRLGGTLWVGSWWPVRIELELVRYSRVASEIALRPSTIRWPVGMERYGQDAATAVEGIVTTITMGVPVPVDRAGESMANRSSCSGRTLLSSPHGFTDRIAGRPRAFDPVGD